MRVKQADHQVSDPKVEITFNGTPLSALHGETISATLHAHGIQTIRAFRSGQPRGLYCGMGSCFECVVTVDGREGVRACLEKVEHGQRVRSEIPLGTDSDPLMPLCNPPATTSPQEVPVDLLIIGAGPAGLSAAIAAAKAGVSVIVLDERPQSGGQYFKPLAPSHHTAKPSDAQFAQGKIHTESALALGVRIFQDTTVWGADAPNEVVAFVNGAEVIFRPSKLILATGAYERPVPFANWTLPGVMTTGAAQTLVRSYKVSPGMRVVIAGNGPLNLQLAVEMLRAGVKVVALIESAQAPSLSQWKSMFQAWKSSPDLMLQGLNYLKELRLNGVQVQWAHAIEKVIGEDTLRKVHFAPVNSQGLLNLDKRVEVEADTLCLGYGFIPSTEMARALGCDHTFVDQQLGYLQTDTSFEGRTSIRDVFAVGDGSAIGGARVAMARGRLAGLSVAADLNKDPASADLALSQRSLSQSLEFQKALWQIFKAPPPLLSQIPDEAIACRCEEITVGQLRASIAQGFDSLATLKRMTRLGMGRCQGRYCACTASKLIQEVTGRTPVVEQFFAPRLPLKPVPVGSMVFEKPEWGGHKRSITPNLARSIETGHLPTQEAEVVIIGAGVMGACLAYYLAKEGKDVLVIERDEANLQASGANAGSLHVQLLSFDFGAKAEAGGGPAAQTLPLGPLSVDLWRQLERDTDSDFEISITGGLMVADTKAGMDFLKAKANLERQFGIENEIIDASTLRDLAPAISDVMLGAEYAPQEGKINPLKATYGILNAAKKMGVRFSRGASVESIERVGNDWHISTNRGMVKAGLVINAAGPWSREIAAMVGVDLPVHSAPLQMIVTETAPPLVKQLVAHADRHLSLKQAVTGGLIVGGGWTASHNEKRRFNTAMRQSVEGNLWVAQRVLPQLQGLRVLRTWAAMNINIDGAPIMGAVPHLPGFYNAVTSNGYTLSPVVARMTADLVMGRTSLANHEPFSLNRFK